MIFRLGAHFTMFQLGWDFWLREVALSTWFHSIKYCQMTKAFRHAAWIYTQWISHWIMDFGDKSHAWDRSCTTVEINLLLLAASHPGPGLVRLGLTEIYIYGESLVLSINKTCQNSDIHVYIIILWAKAVPWKPIASEKEGLCGDKTSYTSTLCWQRIL